MNLAYWLNTAWMQTCRREARAWESASRRVAAAQADLLQRMVEENADTEFGRRHGFARIDSPAAFQARVPLSAYEAYAEPIARIAAGAPNVLTRSPVQLFEPTSGTTSGEKLIPYTAELRRQYQRMAAAWIFNLMRQRPAIRRGRAYWSISPALGASRRTPAGIPIGFDDDTAYLGPAGRWLANRVLAVPGSIAKVSPIENFQYLTLLHLLRARDLTLISVWSPTFLEALLGRLDEWSDRLCFDLQADESAAWAAEAIAVLRSGSSRVEKTQRLWPRLALVSCWADAASTIYADRLRTWFPQVEFQPKGLLATEGCVSFPLLGEPGGVLALRSHFFEFQELDGDEDGRRRLAHQVEMGGRYRVVLTTGGGLYRYQLGDLVEVVGFHNQCPRLRFLGRWGTRCDLVGEKLAEAFVQEALGRALAAHGLTPRFAMLAPAPSRPPRYRLYLQPAAETPPAAVLQSLADALQAGLEANPHYRYAIDLQQLGCAELTILDPAAEPAWAAFHRRRVAQGQKPGDVKPAALDAWTGWEEAFAGWITPLHPRLAARRMLAAPAESPHPGP